MRFEHLIARTDDAMLEQLIGPLSASLLALLVSELATSNKLRDLLKNLPLIEVLFDVLDDDNDTPACQMCHLVI